MKKNNAKEVVLFLVAFCSVFLAFICMTVDLAYVYMDIGGIRTKLKVNGFQFLTGIKAFFGREDENLTWGTLKEPFTDFPFCVGFSWVQLTICVFLLLYMFGIFLLTDRKMCGE